MGILAEPVYRALFGRLVAPVAAMSGDALDAIATLAETAVASGHAPGKLAKAIVDAGVVDIDRKTAQLVGLTATGILYNVQSLRGYEASGRVTRVHVYDGPECPGVDGTVWPLARALAEPLGCAACTRAFSPVTVDER